MSKTKNKGSMRVRLAMTYAGIAALTALILGGILLGVLANYYGQAEDAYLHAAAVKVLSTAGRSTNASELASWAKIEALRNQVRVQVIGPGEVMIVDSGSPDRIDPGTLGGPPGRNDSRSASGATQQNGPRPDGGDRLPAPLGGGLFSAGAGSPRSPRSLQASAAQAGFPSGSMLVISEGPASGVDALVAVAETWVIAALLALVLAAVTGWFVASRIAHPIDLLTDVSNRMASGDLSARADVHRDDEVGRLADSFNAMAERTETTVSTLRRFVGDAAHEIGTPLTALQADLDLADARAGSPDERRLIGRAQVQVRRLGTLSENLLRLSRLEAGDRTVQELERLDLNDIARHAADTIASRAEAAGLTFTLETADGPLPITADRIQLLVVAENLLDNAVKFTPEGGTVALATSSEAGCAVLTVADSGIGIPEAEQGEVFERFHRARNAASVSGSGLGLAIVVASVERVGGHVSLESSPEGTTLRVALPLAEVTAS